ncbi:MAG: DUF6285 domain-containing protein [Myxococcota bacterium]
MNDRPTGVELLRAVERFLELEAVPHLEGPLRFHARVAANVVAIVAREIETEETQLGEEWARLADLLGEARDVPSSRDALREAVAQRTDALVSRIRAGEADAGDFRARVLDHLRRTVEAKLTVSRPPRQRARPASS